MPSDDYYKLTWTCHVCGSERPDAKISVVSSEKQGCKVNRRYCNDSATCRTSAKQQASAMLEHFVKVLHGEPKEEIQP